MRVDLKSSYGRAVFAKVSRSWRQVALGSPEIWSYIDCGDVLSTNLYLRRSKKVPLDIYVPRLVRRTTLQRVFGEVDRLSGLE